MTQAAGTIPRPTITPTTSVRRRTEKQRGDEAHKQFHVVNVRLPDPVLNALAAEGKRVGLPKSTLARRFIEQGLAGASQAAQAPDPANNLAALVRGINAAGALVADALRQHYAAALDDAKTPAP